MVVVHPTEVIAKMAEDVNDGVERALNVIVCTTESSGTMKEELKNIFD